MSVAEESLEGQLIGGRWRVGALLGKGGVGVVYRGEHAGTERPVAIKVLHGKLAKQEEFRRRFEREARAASKLSHPACVSVLDFGEHEGHLYLVMEFADGHLLLDRIEKGPLPPTEAVRIANGIAVALRHAHALGIVHRDVKPENVMLLDHDASGVACKLLDFGGAKSLTANPRDVATGVGMTFGSPSYLSPEQCKGNPADARSDLYALGVVLFVMLTARKPFEHKDVMQVLYDHMHTPAPKVRTLAPKVSLELEAVVARLLEKDPAQRFQSANDVLSALSEVPESGPQKRTERHKSPPEPPARKRPAWLAPAAIAIACGIALAVWLVLRR